MRLFIQVRRLLVVGATLGLLMPQASFAVERTSLAPIRDVALQQDGTLRGEALSVQGQAAAGETISLTAHGQTVAEAEVGADGKFAMAGLRPGVYSIVRGNTQSVVRLWSPVAAPPAAAPELLLVQAQDPVVRGLGPHHLMPSFEHPFLVGGLLLSAGVIGGVIGYNIRNAPPAS